MQKTVNFKKKMIASAIASVVGFSGAAFAQDDAEEIVVTGIKASLQASMEIKRQAVGVVDAISAEDIGKMPDTNLAESLQRITGVSIDRAGGEGSKVTVRGFGADYNLVTLNGRAMPSSGFDSRSFEFADLASESVSGLEVYKTGRASVASGGIGATINIKTIRPLDHPGLKASIGGKAVHDTTVREGAAVTPEISGLFSNTFADDTIGVSLTGSYQKRDQGNAGAYSQQWNTSVWDSKRGNDNFSTYQGKGVVTNAPKDGQLFSTPIDYRLILGDQERERTNGQLTFQYKPTENLKATLDYTYSELDWHQDRIEQSLWFVGARTAVTFDNQTVKTPVLFTEYIDSPKDISFARQVQGNHRENNAVGFNLEFTPTDDLSLSFDYFKAKAETREYDPRGNLNLSVAANVVKQQSMNWNPGLPIMTVVIDDTVSGNGNGKLDAADMTTTAGTTNYNWVGDDIEQIRLDGSWKFEDSSLDFGIESRSNDYLGRSRGDCCIVFGDWGGTDAKNVPDSFWTPRNFLSDFDGYNLGTSFTGGMDWDFNQVAGWVESQNGKLPNFRDFPPSGKFEAKPRVSTYRGIVEDVQAAYLQYKLSGELSGMPYHVLAGVRYEKTDVTSSTKAANPTRIRWTGDDDFISDASADLTAFSREASYNHTLPSVDFDIDLTDSIKARLSASKTIARPTYGNLRADIGVGDFRTYSASQGNPGLLPLESQNLDASIEWYYDESSYVSLGLYRKNVDKFNSTQAVDGTLFGLRDVTKGPRAVNAKNQLIASGNTAPSLQEIYNQVLKNQGDVGPNGNVVPNDQDPVAVWHINTPINNKSAVIDGAEFAVQHMFGDSGFGVSANYTTVNGDIAYDNNKLGTQFALVGMSDSANGAVFYDKDGLQARIAYNWRDKFLDTTNQYNNEPGYTEAFETWDASVSYQFTEQLSVSLEGLNLLGEDKRRHGRTQVQLWNLEILGPRYTLGARYSF